jgi:hypothetical protein
MCSRVLTNASCLHSPKFKLEAFFVVVVVEEELIGGGGWWVWVVVVLDRFASFKTKVLYGSLMVCQS